VGVIHAWEYVKYKGYPPLGTPYTPLKVAIIDAGFDLDETTGVPLYGGPDYSAALTQIDAVNGDWTAGGLGYGFPNCPNGCWHGQMSFGTCCALANNGWGTAGTSGGWEVKPLVIKVSGDIDTVSSAVYNAIYNNADVIAEAAGFICGWGCRNFGGGNVLKAAVGSARNHGAIFVTPANNQGQDISNVDQYPCVLNGAVCVGAVTSDGLAAGYSNWGSVVDIWAPTDVLTTVTRDSGGQPYQFGGTSASGPYLAGIVALMKMLDPDLTYDEVRSILVSTANASADPKVSSRGYVDAYRAVAAAKPNLSPMVAIAQPANNASPDYHEVYFSTQVTDPETPSPLWGPADFPSKVVVSSDRNGELCSAAADATGTGTTIGCYATKDLDPGVHTITATATDPFGATGSHAITINVANDPPTTVITFPASGSTYYTSQMVNLRGYGFDPDLGQYLPDASLSWSSSLGGALGTGSDIWASLIAGTHTITLTAVDELGVSGSDSISITVQTGVGYPTVQILKPANGDTVGSGTAVTFEGRATDPEDGTITEDARFKWYSSRDGLLGTGRLIQSTLSTVGESAEHIITLEVIDNDGHTATHAIKVYVVSPA
jgi:hypothetical protein